MCTLRLSVAGTVRLVGTAAGVRNPKLSPCILYLAGLLLFVLFFLLEKRNLYSLSADVLLLCQSRHESRESR